ncbi:hypothetical protein MRB53_005934 [Persea americana]|uniref:Uncharacterized protein n=1 Tax=Persea americana TaxID=3435 RepID=A0ACC2MEI3_PERAE|nr:hypothetical protein MRB53_005934 [Persea americana]
MTEVTHITELLASVLLFHCCCCCFEESKALDLSRLRNTLVSNRLCYCYYKGRGQDLLRSGVIGPAATRSGVAGLRVAASVVSLISLSQQGTKTQKEREERWSRMVQPDDGKMAEVYWCCRRAGDDLWVSVPC